MRTKPAHLALSIVALALVPAGVAFGAPPALTSFKDVEWETYVHPEPAFTLQYPYAFRVDTPDRPGQLFFAHGASRSPGITVSRLERPAGLSLDDSALTAARQLNANFVVESRRELKLGELPARAVVGRWTAPIGAGIPLRSLVISAFVDQHWMVVFATDGVASGGLLPELGRSALSIRFGTTAVQTPQPSR
jgi:hypothetical protein